jgi:hypothetical protein
MADYSLYHRAFLDGVSRVATTAATPMSVHRNTILLGSIEALGDNFPVVRALVGEQAFVALALDHSEVSPPGTPVLAHYGKAFPAWLAAHPIAAELPYLADVADCERLWAESLHAADEVALELTDLQEVQIELLLQEPLALHPATRFAWQKTPGIAIWLAHQNGPPEELKPDWRPAGALFTRSAFAVEGSEIDAVAFRLLSGIGKGERLEQAAEAVIALHPEADIGSCFAGLVQRGAFAARIRERSLP